MKKIQKILNTSDYPYLPILDKSLLIQQLQIKKPIDIHTLVFEKCQRTKRYNEKKEIKTQIIDKFSLCNFYLEWSYLYDTGDEYYEIDTVENSKKPDRKNDNGNREPCHICQRQIGKTLMHKGLRGIKNCSNRRKRYCRSCRSMAVLKCTYEGCGKTFRCLSGKDFNDKEAINHLINDHQLISEFTNDLGKMEVLPVIQHLTKLQNNLSENPVVKHYEKLFIDWIDEIEKEILDRDIGENVARFSETFDTLVYQYNYKKEISDRFKDKIDNQQNKKKLWLIFQKFIKIKSLEKDIDALINCIVI